MGKKKRKSKASEPEVPVFYIKKQKLNAETKLTALVALHKYCHKFKLGAPGFREKSQAPFTITTVMNGTELGTAQHGDRDAAVEKAALITLHLLDPEGKSIVANIAHSDEGELKALCQHIINAKQDEIKALAQSAAAAVVPHFLPGMLVPRGALPPAAGGGLVLAPAVLAPFPPFPPTGVPPPFAPGLVPPPPFAAVAPPPPGSIPAPPPPSPFGGVPGVPPLTTTTTTTTAAAPAATELYGATVPLRQPPGAGNDLPPASGAPANAPLPPLVTTAPAEPRLVWTDETTSPEEARAAMPRYHSKRPDEQQAENEEQDEDFVERALAEHEANEAALAYAEQLKRTTDLGQPA